MKVRTRFAAAFVGLLLYAAACSNAPAAPSSGVQPSGSAATASTSASALISPELNASDAVGSLAPTLGPNASPGSWPAFVASIDPVIRGSTIQGNWAVTYTLLRFEGKGVDYKPYLPIGGTEEWSWAVVPACAAGPCDVTFKATSPLLSGTYPSDLEWLEDDGQYFSSGITALPQAYCRDANGARIQNSYQVRQGLMLVPTLAEGTGDNAQASVMNGLRVDEGMPVSGMPANCGTFQEVWALHAERPS